MDLAVLRDAVGPRIFDYNIDELRQAGYTLAQAYRTVARNFRTHNTQSRFDKKLLTGHRKRDREGRLKDVAKKLNFAEAPMSNRGGDDVNFRRTKTVIGRTKKRTANDVFKATIGDMDEVVFRWQACSASLLGPGRVPIAFGVNATEPLTQCVPIHMMSLTTHPAFQSSQTLGAIDKGMCRFVYRSNGGTPSTIEGHFGYQHLYGQNRVGVTSGGNWSLESGRTGLFVDKVFHKYTDIRLNLYGATSYPLKYRVMVVSGMPVEMQPFEYAPVSGTVATAPGPLDFPIFKASPLNEFILDHVRPLVSNPIVGSNSDLSYKGKIRVVSDVTYEIPCLSYGDAADEATSSVNSTNVRNVNIFLRHDKFRDYGWRSLVTDKEMTDTLDNSGWTLTNISSQAEGSLLIDVDREERMFLVISCTCPTKEVDTVWAVGGPTGGSTADATSAHTVSGSYDIVVRNCFRDGSAPSL